MIFRSLVFTLSASSLAACAAAPADDRTGPDLGVVASDPPGLVARAVLPAATFADGPVSGAQISGGLVGGLFPSQPVQGISSLVDAHDGQELRLSRIDRFIHFH